MLGAFLGAFRKTPPFCGRDPASLTASLASDVIARLHDSSTGLRLHLSHFTAAPHLGNRPVLKRQSDNTWHAHGAARYVGDTNHVQLRDAVLVAILGVDQQSFVALVRVVCGDVSHCGPCAACSACVKCPSRFSSVSVSSALRSSTQSGAPSRSKHSAV